MPVLTFFYRNGLWLSWLTFVLGAFLLWTCITAAAKLGGRYRVASLPLVSEQRIEFPAAGKVVLWLEGPQLTRRFGGLTFELIGRDGSVLRGSPALLRNRSSGLSTVRISDRIFEIPHAGSYTLTTGGLDVPQPGDEKHRIVFLRPHQMETVRAVVGIILGGILVIGSLVNFFLRLAAGVGR